MMKNIKAEVGQDKAIADPDGNYKKLATRFSYDRLMLEGYYFSDSDGVQTINVPYNYGFDWRNYVTSIKCNTAELLCEMLALRSRLPAELFNSYTNSSVG